MLDPGPDFAKTPAQTVAVLRRLDALHALGRPVLLAVSRKDFLGAITGRGPRERGAGTLAAVGRASTPARTCCASTTSPRRPTSSPSGRSLRGERELGARTRASTPRPLSAGRASLLRAHGCRPLRTTRPGCRPTHTEGGPHVSVLDRSALEESPLADLHLLANELGVDGFRRLRKADLIDAILARQAGDDAGADAEVAADDAEARRAPRPRRAPRRRAPRPTPSADADAERRGRARRGGRGRRDRRGRAGARAAAGAAAAAVAAAAATRPATARPRRARAARRARGRGPRRRGRRRAARQRLGLRAPRPAGADRRRRLRLRRAGQALRARLRRPRRRPGARAAPLGALPVAGPRRHDQRPPGRRGRRGHAASRTCPPRSRPSASSSAPRTRPSRRSSG